MTRCDLCDVLQPPHAWSLYNQDCKYSRLGWEEDWEYFEDEEEETNKKNCDERCWELACWNLAENYAHHCSKHRLESGESYCSTSDCYYKTSGYGHCYSCQVELYPKSYTGYCSHTDCLNKISRYASEKYCSDHRNICLISGCDDRISEKENYCFSHQKEQEELKSLVRSKTSLSNPQEIIRFETYWNNNLATVVNYNGNYWVFLLVYDDFRSVGEVKENSNLWIFPISRYSESYWGDSGQLRKTHNSLSDASSEASWLRSRFSYGKYYDSPILLIHPDCDSYRSFSSIIKEPYVISNQVGTCTKTDNIPLVYANYSSSRPSDLNRHFKPLDIVWVQCVDRWVGSEFYHVGVYVGENTIFHYSGDNNAVEKTTWEGFLKSNFFHGITGKILRYHPLAPFKNYKTITGEAVWAKDRDFWRNNYNLPNRNCEHFSNMLVYGINYSRQVYERTDELKIKAGVQVGGGAAIAAGSVGLGVTLAPFTFGLSLVPAAVVGTGGVIMVGNAIESQSHFNNNKGSTIKLTNEIKEVDKMFGTNLDSETERYERQYLQEIPTKEYCQIM